MNRLIQLDSHIGPKVSLFQFYLDWLMESWAESWADLGLTGLVWVEQFPSNLSTLYHDRGVQSQITGCWMDIRGVSAGRLDARIIQDYTGWRGTLSFYLQVVPNALTGGSYLIKKN